jgi:hypothetical protein
MVGLLMGKQKQCVGWVEGGTSMRYRPLHLKPETQHLYSIHRSPSQTFPSPPKSIG